MGGDGNGCGIVLLRVKSNKLLATNYLHSPDGTAFVLWVHATLSGECNYYFCISVIVLPVHATALHL